MRSAHAFSSLWIRTTGPRIDPTRCEWYAIYGRCWMDGRFFREGEGVYGGRERRGRLEGGRGGRAPLRQGPLAAASPPDLLPPPQQVLWLGARAAGASTGALVTQHVGGGGGEGPAQRQRRKLAASTAQALPRSSTVGSLVRPRSCPLLGGLDDAKCAGEGGRGCTPSAGCGDAGRGRSGQRSSPWI